jgi:acetyl-CoA decarbonylase/synthase complex subunit gamma
MALTGLDIYKLLPKTNCKACGFATCLAFAMALAQKKTSLDKCPYVSAEAQAALESASQPPIKLVTVGSGDGRLEIGNETVMYRHEQKFYHPAGIGFLVEDTLSGAELHGRIAKINALKFERIGLTLKPDAVVLRNSSSKKEAFLKVIEAAISGSTLNLVLDGKDPAVIEAGLAACKAKRPLIVCGDNSKLDTFIKIANENSVPLAAAAGSAEEAALLTQRIKAGGVEEMVINLISGKIWRTIQASTFIRRMALKKTFRPLGYPVMVYTTSLNAPSELAEAITYVEKYAGLVVVRDIEKEFILPLLVARQDIYTDPQKPVQVEPKIYEIGKVTKTSPVIVTTNFSITYFTVAGEVESSRVPTYIICCDAEGMSVLTAWAAEKFTAEKISDTLKRSGIEGIVSHRNVIIPGYVSVLSGRLAEESGWKVSVGPREASGIPNYLKGFKS